jgi:hypothetical protein
VPDGTEVALELSTLAPETESLTSVLTSPSPDNLQVGG